MHTPRTPLHLGRPSRVQRYSSSMHRALEEDSLMIRHDEESSLTTYMGKGSDAILLLHHKAADIIFTNIILMVDKHNIPKGKMHSYCRLLPEDIVCKITHKKHKKSKHL